MPWGRQGGYPARSSWGGVPCWGGVPREGYPPSQVRVGGYPCRVPPLARSGWGVPCRGGYPAGGTQVGYPPPARSGWGGGYPVRTTEGVLASQRTVCLLRSRRRTFLFDILFLSQSLFLPSQWPELHDSVSNISSIIRHFKRFHMYD